MHHDPARSCRCQAGIAGARFMHGDAAMNIPSLKAQALVLAAVIFAACAADNGAPADGTDTDVASDTASSDPASSDTASGSSATGDYPIDVPASWTASSLPPPSALVRDGACPFECCQYGAWSSDSATVVYRTARDTGDVAFTLPANTTITAESGTVFVTSLVRVVFDAPMSEEQIGVPGVSALTPADTLYLIEPIGEGAFIVWLRGAEVELPGIWESYYPGTTARMDGKYAREWWVRVHTEDGREGWVWMDRTKAPMRGADGCS